MQRLAILGSTRGTVMLDLIHAIQTKKLNAGIEIVISNKNDALILEKARDHHLPTEFVDPKLFSKEDYDHKISEILHQFQIDTIVLIGFMRILSNAFINEWRNKIINVHPSLLPDFAGMMDKTVHESVIQSGKTETGCTVHYVTEKIDAGPILIQKKCQVLPNDTIETLKNRVQKLEGEALIEAIQLMK